MAKRDRQKRLVKKRARREKRLAKRVAYYSRTAPSPLLLALPKMSEDLVEFAAPLLDTLDEAAGAAEWRSVLLLAATVWNMSCVVERCLEESGDAEAEATRFALVSGLVEVTAWPRDKCETLVANLEERKRTLFGGDPRFVVDVRTVDTEDGVHVSAVSRF